VEHVELYACFPAIVQMSARALGFDLERELTITGGLGFAGAPIGNSAGQGIAAMVARVRSGGYGLVHANGGTATKHAVGIYANAPSEGFRRIDCQDTVDLKPRAAAGSAAAGVVEASTVLFDRDGPTHVLATFQAPDGTRGLTRSADAGVMAKAMTAGLAGDPAPLPG